MEKIRTSFEPHDTPEVNVEIEGYEPLTVADLLVHPKLWGEVCKIRDAFLNMRAKLVEAHIHPPRHSLDRLYERGLFLDAKKFCGEVRKCLEKTSEMSSNERKNLLRVFYVAAANVEEYRKQECINAKLGLK